MVWLGIFLLAFLAFIVLFLLALLLFQTRVAAGLQLSSHVAKVNVEAAFLLRMLKIRFRLQGETKDVTVVLGKRAVFRKNLAQPEKPPAPKKDRPKKSHPKKKLALWKTPGAVRSYWAVFRVFLRRFFAALHAFQLRGDVRVGLGSPAQTGLLLGAWHGVKHWLPSHNFVFTPDFLEKKAEGWVVTELQVRLIQLLWVGVPFYWGLRRISRTHSA